MNRSSFISQRPGSGAELRRRAYDGQIFLFEPNTQTHAFVTEAERLMADAFEPHAPRLAAAHLTNAELFKLSGRIRKHMYSDPTFRSLAVAVIESVGIDPSVTGLDPARFRTVVPYGHEIPAAAAVYYSHRDTWYADPLAILNWWIPMHDVDRTNSFCFFPAYFDQPIKNDSEVFNLDEWLAKDDKKLIGWQDPKAGLEAKYPQGLHEPEGDKLWVECERASLLVFSGQHLHRTNRQTTELTRFSVDFRTVDFADQASGRHPRNVDDRSTGSWKLKYLPAADD